MFTSQHVERTLGNRAWQPVDQNHGPQSPMELDAYVMIFNILQNEKNVIALQNVKGSRSIERLRMFPP